MDSFDYHKLTPEQKELYKLLCAHRLTPAGHSYASMYIIQYMSRHNLSYGDNIFLFKEAFLKETSELEKHLFE